MDIARNSVKNGHMIIWEEVARDGAQAKTLLSGEQRARIALQQAKIFGEHGPNHIIFAAGYPAICKEEYEAVLYVADHVDRCSVATHGRALKSDIDLGIQAMRRAVYGRVTFAIPISDSHSRVMLNKSKAEALQLGIELSRYALDKSGGIPIDVALGGGCQEDPIFLAEAATALTEEGVSIVKICDSGGELFTFEIHRLFNEVLRQLSSDVVIGAHLHNDYGMALASNIETVRVGVRVVAGSWLGIGERNGLAATEQLLFALAYDPDCIVARLGLNSPLWIQPPDLKQLIPLAQEISHLLGVPIKSTDPVISSAMNHISTGAYYNDPETFKPFDPEAILGVPPTLVLTHLANHSIIETVANKMGYQLSEAQISEALAWVKSYAYQNLRSVISHDEFTVFLNNLKSFDD